MVCFLRHSCRSFTTRCLAAKADELSASFFVDRLLDSETCRAREQLLREAIFFSDIKLTSSGSYVLRNRGYPKAIYPLPTTQTETIVIAFMIITIIKNAIFCRYLCLS